MKTKPALNMEKIARGLRAERIGEVRAGGGHFGAMQLVAEVQARFRSPEGGGRGTDPAWTERRLLPLAPETLRRLEHLSKALRGQGVAVTPLQVAGLLLEGALGDADDERVAELARHPAS